MRDFHLKIELWDDGKDVTEEEPALTCREALFTAESMFDLLTLLDPQKLSQVNAVSLSTMLENFGSLGKELLSAAYGHLEKLEDAGTRQQALT